MLLEEQDYSLWELLCSPPVFDGFIFFFLFIYISSRLSFDVVISATISVQKMTFCTFFTFFCRVHDFFVICIQLRIVVSYTIFRTHDVRVVDH